MISSPTNRLQGPIPQKDRIELLDLVRALALLGIFLVNIEFFNRQLGERGLVPQAVGWDRTIGWILYNFVEGKAWILFAFLFGVGVALAYLRTDELGATTLALYWRRVLGIAIFGAFHCIFLWRGDILFLYAISAVGLLIVLHCRTRFVILAIAVFLAAGVIAKIDPKATYPQCLLMLGLAGLYVQSGKRFPVGRLSVDPASGLLLVGGSFVLVVTLIVGTIHGFNKNAPMMLVRSVCLLLTGYIAYRFRQHQNTRILLSAMTLYLLPVILTLASGLLQWSSTVSEPSTLASSEIRPVPINEETQLLTQGTYLENVAWRAPFFVRNALSEASLVTPTVAIFLLGVWCVRSGVISNLKEPHRYWTAFAISGAICGYSLTIGGKWLESIDLAQPVPGVANIASSIITIGSLPASLGIVALIAMVLHRKEFMARVGWLLPVGRMALTNYLLQSVVCAGVFYGSGLGQWGMGRCGQVGLVAVVFAAQILLSNVWLSRFRMGPCEWVLRAITYGRISV
jgi:uncharacterized protein